MTSALLGWTWLVLAIAYVFLIIAYVLLRRNTHMIAELRHGRRCLVLVAKSGTYQALCPLPHGHAGDHALTTSQAKTVGLTAPPF